MLFTKPLVMAPRSYGTITVPIVAMLSPVLPHRLHVSVPTSTESVLLFPFNNSRTALINK